MLNHARLRQLLSREHFSVDGTLIEAWASMKSFRPKDGTDEPPGGGRNGSRDFHGERRRNDSHASTIDGEARLFRKGAGKEARLCFMGHLLMENRSGLVVAAHLTQAIGWAEREAAGRLIEGLPGRHRITVGADRAYDTADFVAGLRELNATPHVAQNLSGRASRIDRRTVRHPGYLASQRARKRIEEAFGLQPDPPAQVAGSAVICASGHRDPHRATTPSTATLQGVARAFAGAESKESPDSSAAC